MLQAVLNTKGYMGGSPFDKDGLDTYQLMGWSKNARLTRINFLVDEGDIKKIKIELYDRPYGSDAKLLYSEIIDRVFHKSYSPLVELKGALFDRMYVRLTAIDGEQQNHCKAVFFGEQLNA